MNLPTNSTVKIAGIAVALSVLGGALAGNVAGATATAAPRPKWTQRPATEDEFCAKVAELHHRSPWARPTPRQLRAAVKDDPGMGR